MIYARWLCALAAPAALAACAPGGYEGLRSPTKLAVIGERQLTVTAGEATSIAVQVTGENGVAVDDASVVFTALEPVSSLGDDETGSSVRATATDGKTRLRGVARVDVVTVGPARIVASVLGHDVAPVSFELVPAVIDVEIVARLTPSTLTPGSSAELITQALAGDRPLDGASLALSSTSAGITLGDDATLDVSATAGRVDAGGLALSGAAVTEVRVAGDVAPGTYSIIVDSTVDGATRRSRVSVVVDEVRP